MKVLLVTDIPPCKNFTAGLVLDRLVSFLPANNIALCAVINPTLNPEIPSELQTIPTLLLKKPREASLRLLPLKLGSIIAFLYELFQAAYVKFKILPLIVKFAKEQKVEAIWIVLQGQTMIRLARPMSRKLNAPLFTQVWDPFSWWLRANRIDSMTQKRLLDEFDAVIKSSKACATASWAMSENYLTQYGIRNLPVIAGLPKQCLTPPAQVLHQREELVIGMAGQFYAQDAWNCLINTLNQVGWKIAGKTIRIRVMGGGFQNFTQSPANFEYLGWQTQEETIRLLSDSDLLYLPYWFSAEFAEESSNSFPSKLVTYFASGRPVFCHAPAYSSPAKYLSNNAAGYLCDSMDPKIVLQHLNDVITKDKNYSTITFNAHQSFIRDFTLEQMQKAFFEFLNVKNFD